MEFMHPSMKLFVPCPNSTHKIDGTAEELVPHPDPVLAGSDREKWYFHVGVLISMCYISKLPQPLPFSRLVWNGLTSQSYNVFDVFEADVQFRKFVTEELPADQTYEVLNSIDVPVELIAGGSKRIVTPECRKDFLQQAIRFRLDEFITQIDAIRKGFNEFFPAAAAMLLSPWELRELVCGQESIEIEEMKKHCIVSDRGMAEMLWKVLAKFSRYERMMFIRFGSGRMSLPPPGADWGTKLNIYFASSNLSDARKPLPTAATCSSSMTIPRYTTEEWMEKKLRAAVLNAASIDTDGTPAWSAVASFT
jgi:hypothetical protein